MTGKSGSVRIPIIAFAMFALPFTEVARSQDSGAQRDAGVATDHAQATPLPANLKPTCKLSLNPPKIATGEVTSLRLDCKLAKGTRATVAKEQTLAPLELIDHEATSAPNKQQATFELKLLALAPGRIDLAGIDLHVNAPDGKHYSWTAEQPISVEVTSVLGNEPNAEPKPARPPVSVIEDDYTLAYVGVSLLAAVVLILLTLFLSRWWRGRARSEPPPPPPRPAWAIARERLGRLRQSRQRAFEESGAEQWVDALSDTLREYLGERYGFEGLESTTDELLAELQKAHTPELSLPELSALFGDWDLIKFAKAAPDAEQCEQWVERSLDIVEQTTPSAPLLTSDEGAVPRSHEDA